MVLLCTNFCPRYRERHQVSVNLWPSSPFRGCVSSDSQNGGSKIALVQFVVSELGFRNFCGGVTL